MTLKEKVKKIFKKSKWLGNTLLTIILMAIIIAIYVALNMFVESRDLIDIDLTKQKLYSLSSESKDKIASVTEDTNIVLYGMSSNPEVIDFAKLYNKENSHITYQELVDATERPDLQQEYGIGSSVNSIIIIENAQRKKIVTTDQLYTYDYTTYEQIDITEQTLTNAILAVNLEKNPKIYFVTNHAEYANDFQYATVYLENESNEVEQLDLLINGKVPEDCDVLILTTPKEDITEFERDEIIAYINNGGDMIILSDPNYNKLTLTNFQSVLDVYGVQVSTGVIFERDPSYIISEYSNMIIPQISSSSDITKYIASDGAVTLMNAGILTYKTEEELENMGVSREDLLVTRNTSILTDTVSQYSDGEQKELNEEPIASILTKVINKENEESKTSKLVIFANNFFATDLSVLLNGSNSNSNTRVTAITFYNNKDLIINTVSYLTQRTDNITIRKDTGVITYTATEKENTIIKIIIIALPILVILTGIIVWQVRRRK